MNAIVDLQIADENSSCPSQKQCEQVLQMVLDTLGITESKECTIRVVGEKESAELNEQYRGKEGATNVLSFRFDSPIDIEVDLLGDLIICSPIVVEQAKAQHKSEAMHWHHLIVHGCLHLLGYDHLDDADSDKMEALECEIMMKLGYSDPYESTSNL